MKEVITKETVDLLLCDCPACTGCIQLIRLPAFIIASGD